MKTVCFYGSDTVNIKTDTLFAGKMNEGENAILEFAIVNKSSSPIVISRISSGCGCTSVQWKNTPIESGEKRGVTVFYNSSGQFGKQFKTITVNSESGEERCIFLAADVNF